MLSIRRTLNLRNFNYGAIPWSNSPNKLRTLTSKAKVQIGDIWKEINKETGVKKVNIPQKYCKFATFIKNGL